MVAPAWPCSCQVKAQQQLTWVCMRAGMQETQDKEVTLTECHPDTLEAVLQFCYMGECRRPKKDMLRLLVMADRLDMPCLTAICEKVWP